MAIKGNKAKNEIFSKLMEMFPGSFMYNGNKELRVNLTEEGDPVQIKVTLTAAKVAVEPSAEDLSESATIKSERGGELNFGMPAPQTQSAPTTAAALEPTQKEKDNVAKLVKALNLQF